MNEQPDEHAVQPTTGRPRRPAGGRGGGITLPLILILLGIGLLLTTTGVLTWQDWTRLWPLWPVVLILLGLDILVGSRSPFLRLLVALVAVVVLVGVGAYLILTASPLDEDLQLRGAWPLEGIERGVVTLQMRSGQLELAEEQDRGVFARVEQAGDEGGGWSPSFEIEPGGVAMLEISSSTSSWAFSWFEESRWQVGLTDRVPLALRIEGGVGESRLDLSALQVEELDLRVGVGDLEVILPAAVERGEVTISGGIGSVTVLVPQGVGVRVQWDAGVGSVNVDRDRFREIADGYESQGYDQASSRIDVQVNIGIGEVEVRYR